MKKNIIILLLVSLLFACKNKTPKVDNCPSNIDSIYISYLNYDFMNCFTLIDFDYLKNAHRPTFKKEYYGTEGKYRIDYQGVIDTVLTDCVILTEIERALKNSIRNDMFINQSKNEARMSMEIAYSDNTRDTLMFADGWYFYSNKNEGYANFDELVYLLRKNTGFYSWQRKEKPEYLDSYFFELDTLNRRDSIKIWLDNNPIVQGSTLDW